MRKTILILSIMISIANADAFDDCTCSGTWEEIYLGDVDKGKWNPNQTTFKNTTSCVNDHSRDRQTVKEKSIPNSPYINVTTYIESYKCKVCNEPNDEIPRPPQDENWKLVSSSTCGHGGAPFLADNNTTLSLNYKASCCVNTDYYRKCEEGKKPGLMSPYECVIDPDYGDSECSDTCGKDKGICGEHFNEIKDKPDSSYWTHEIVWQDCTDCEEVGGEFGGRCPNNNEDEEGSCSFPNTILSNDGESCICKSGFHNTSTTGLNCKKDDEDEEEDDEEDDEEDEDEDDKEDEEENEDEENNNNENNNNNSNNNNENNNGGKGSIDNNNSTDTNNTQGNNGNNGNSEGEEGGEGNNTGEGNSSIVVFGTENITKSMNDSYKNDTEKLGNFFKGIATKYIKLHTYELPIALNKNCKCTLDDIAVKADAPAGDININFSEVGLCSVLDKALNVIKMALLIAVYFMGIKYIREVF